MLQCFFFISMLNFYKSCWQLQKSGRKRPKYKKHEKECIKYKKTKLNKTKKIITLEKPQKYARIFFHRSFARRTSGSRNTSTNYEAPP